MTQCTSRSWPRGADYYAVLGVPRNADQADGAETNDVVIVRRPVSPNITSLGFQGRVKRVLEFLYLDFNIFYVDVSMVFGFRASG